MRATGFGEAVAPRETREALQRIDADAELVHLGGNEWLLGVRQPNPAAQTRIRKALKTLDTQRGHSGDPLLERELGKEFQLLQFYAKGFKPIHLYHLGELGHDGEPITFGWIVEDFRMRDFNWRVRPLEAEREFKEAISLDAANKRRAQVLADYMDAEGPSLFRYVMKRARSFINSVPILGG